MKKIMLTAATIAALTSTTALAAADEFYVKGNVGWSKLNNVKVTGTGANAKGGSLKSKNDVFFGLGVGYYVMDNVRADLTFDHYASPQSKKHEKDGQDVHLKLKSEISTLMVNGFVDLFDVSVAKVFAGAGVGMSMVSGKYTTKGTVAGVTVDTNAKFKKKNNFAYALHLGASTEFAPGVNGELTYSYRDMGKPKKFEDKATGASATAGQLRGHHVAAGVRFDI